ncbi:MAG: hypothetical protein H0U08_02500 [Actinobacteria bacterium]|nr:hypothetical protein [Actinomycetota bacterium]
MATPSTDAERSRDPRDRPLGRLVLIVAVLAVAFLSARACQSSGDEISSERAVELARAAATFTPDRTQVRLVQRGLPPRAYWGVSLYDVGPNDAPTQVEVYLVDRATGELIRP